jgi:F-type H+-transporting ATPase subunit a
VALCTSSSPIEFVSVLFVRPLSLGPAIRQHARRPSPLVTFAVITAVVGTQLHHRALPVLVRASRWPDRFELLVAILQAFIFTILTAVYIGGSMHEH